MGSLISESMCSSAVNDRNGLADSGGSLGSNKGMRGSLELISKKGLGCNATRSSKSSHLYGHDNSKDGNGSDLMSGKLGDPSIDVFVDLRGQVSGVESDEHVSSQFKASSRRGRKVCLTPTRHCMKTRSSIGRDNIPWYYEEGIVNSCSDIVRAKGLVDVTIGLDVFVLPAFRGEVPKGGPFANLSVESFSGNQALCGSPQLQIPPCKIRTHRKSRTTFILRIVLPLVAASTIVVLAFILVFIKCRERNTKLLPNDDDMSPEATWRRISYQELVRATGGFIESNLLGTAGFGSVYKGRLVNGIEVAIRCSICNLNEQTRVLMLNVHE
ncbi:hypothetical protein LWI29_019836 [Acer saccharum]|uniref:Protein kinase domain-containing protein n=1 Tax=Acer saccharum TaxID=4024 RepID=A0AA39VGB4_ACESA|nr:hypothetical protein LWI29_019836 [Acer saccharum]